jgi:hypothetical protein
MKATMQKIKMKCDKLLIIDNILSTDLSPLIVQFGFLDVKKIQIRICGTLGKLLFFLFLSLKFLSGGIMLK